MLGKLRIARSKKETTVMTALLAPEEAKVPPKVTVLDYMKHADAQYDRIKLAVEKKITAGDIPIIFTRSYRHTCTNVYDVEVDDHENKIEYNRFLELLPKVIEELSVGKNTFAYLRSGSYIAIRATTRYWVQGHGWVVKRVKLAED